MAYFSTLPDTLLFAGVDVQGLTGVVVTQIELFAPGSRRGSHDTVPGRRGQVGAELPYDAYNFGVEITVLAENASGVEAATLHERRALMIANLRGVAAALAGTNGLGTLTRRLAKAGGGYDEHTALGAFSSGLGADLLNVHTGQTELQFTNLDGCWFSSLAPTVPIVP